MIEWANYIAGKILKHCKGMSLVFSEFKMLRFLYHTFQKIMSLRAAALALWRLGNLLLI